MGKSKGALGDIEKMTVKQRKLWEHVTPAKQESSIEHAHELVTSHALRLLDPALENALDEVKRIAKFEIRRLGGIWNEKSFNHLQNTLKDFIVASAIPDEVVMNKFPPSCEW